MIQKEPVPSEAAEGKAQEVQALELQRRGDQREIVSEGNFKRSSAQFLGPMKR